MELALGSLERTGSLLGGGHGRRKGAHRRRAPSLPLSAVLSPPRGLVTFPPDPGTRSHAERRKAQAGQGHHVELAEKYGALVVALEHRFYGDSINPDGLEDHNLVYLSSQQALADIPPFQRFIMQKYKLTSVNTWICFGGSYPGNLAAWFRLKYPDWVFAAVASSAPVRAQLDFTDYNKGVAASFSNPVVGGSKECLEAVTEAFSTADSLVRAGKLDKLAEDFIVCGTLEGMNDGVQLLSNLASIFMGAAQYSNPYDPWWHTVGSMCGIMTHSAIGSTYQRLIAVHNVFLAFMKLLCMNSSYAAWLQELRSTYVVEWRMVRQWFYQRCTAFGYFQTCEDPACPFSRLQNLTFSLDTCVQVYNIPPNYVEDAVDFTNNHYGADNPKASRILFVNGDLDPWHVLSVLKNQSATQLAMVIHGTAHCDDMLPSSVFDPLPLVQAKQRISTQVGEWLKLAREMQQDR